VGGNLVGIEPDAHGVFARSLERDVADARQPRQHVLHVQRCVVRQVQHVARAVRRIEMDGQEDVGRRLSHLHAEALHIFRQTGEGVLDAVLRQHLRDVEVGPDPERHRHGKLAVAGRLAVHVQHVLDAVDLLFERRRDGLRDGLCGRARIGCRDLHRGRHDFRILGDRQDGECAKADQGHEDAEDDGEDRPVDEQVCEAHGRAPAQPRPSAAES
jgi:hypothetical protein